MKPFRFLAFCIPCLVPGSSTHEDLDDSTPPQADPPREQSQVGNSDRFGPMVVTHIRACNVFLTSERVPDGFYATVTSEQVNCRTLKKPMPVGKDVIEWDDEIVLPSDQSSKMTFTVFACFELEPTLAEIETVCKFEIHMAEILDINGGLGPTGLFEEGDGEVLSLVSLDIRFERRVDGLSQHTVLSEVTSMAEHMAISTSSGHPVEQSRVNDHAASFWIRFSHIGGVRRILAPSLPEDGGQDGKVQELNSLGILFSTRYERFGKVVDLEKSISSFEDALQLAPSDHPDRPAILRNLGHSLSARFQRFGDIRELDKLVSMHEDAVKLVPDDHPDKPLSLSNLAFSLVTRYQHLGGIPDLEKSISCCEDGLRLASDDEDTCFLSNNLGLSLASRYKRFGNVIDLEESILKLEDALQLAVDDHPQKPFMLNNLGLSLLARYRRFGDVDDLNASVSRHEHAVQLVPDGHPEKASWSNNLGLSLSARYSHYGDVADLETSILKHEDAVRLIPDDHAEKPLFLSNLAHSLTVRHGRLGNPLDLEKSISRHEEALRLEPDDHPDKPTILNSAGFCFLVCYERFGGVTDLDKSISLSEDVVLLTPDDHPEKPSRLHYLGLSLLRRYELFGRVVDLEKSISNHEEAARLIPDGHPDMYLLLHNLGFFRSTRYQRFGDVADLEKSISRYEDASWLAPDDHPVKSLCLNNLGISLSTRYELFGDVSDLDKSISKLQDAVQLMPEDDPIMPFSLTNLGFSLSIRYRDFGDITDLEESISLYEDALQLMPSDHPRHPALLKNLGDSLSARYLRSGDAKDLEKSISRHEDAVRLTPDGHPDIPLRLVSLASSLLRRLQHSGNRLSSDLPRATMLASRVALSSAGPSHHRFEASQAWVYCIRLSEHTSQSLLDPYTVAINLLPQLAWIGLPFTNRYTRLLEIAETVRDAVAAAVDCDRVELAAEWLEQSRSIVWDQLLQLHTPVDDLRSVHPDIAARFEQISHQLEHASALDGIMAPNVTTSSNVTTGSVERRAQQYHALALTREEDLADIRVLPGFERFLLPKSLDQLSPLAEVGPVVFLNASQYRCDALVVMAGSERVIHIPLPNTSYDQLADMQVQLRRLLNEHVVLPDRSDVDRGARLKEMSADQVFGSILLHLWDRVVGPILEVLGLSTSGATRPRLFWCPTGPFTFLPIHAAGHYGTTNPGPKVSDFVISSYIPSMSALASPHQEHSEATSSQIRLLVVPQPSSDGQTHLSGVTQEMEVIRNLVSSSPFVSFQESDGTFEDVMANMQTSDWVHFSCHGVQDHKNPLDNGLLLANGRRLKVSDVIRLSRPRGGIAFLSACQTAMGNEDLSEEVVHIAAGMILAGYKGVVATMWTIADSDAPRVVEDVYTYMFRGGKVPDGREAAEALHRAIERLRESGAPFLSWVPFIHVGS